jgi:hypothetical protein
LIDQALPTTGAQFSSVVSKVAAKANLFSSITGDPTAIFWSGLLAVPTPNWFQNAFDADYLAPMAAIETVISDWRPGGGLATVGTSGPAQPLTPPTPTATLQGPGLTVTTGSTTVPDARGSTTTSAVTVTGAVTTSTSSSTGGGAPAATPGVRELMGGLALLAGVVAAL